MSANNSQRIRRISLLSSSYSGSTLFSIILCQDKKFFSFGDTYLIPGISDENSLCNCGNTIANCEFRILLGKELKKHGLPESMIVSSEFAIPCRFISSRFGGDRVLAAYKLAGNIVGFRSVYREFYQREARFLSAIEEVSGCDFYIDGNKNLVRTHLFSEENDNTQIIHLIRHPFAVLHSGSTRHKHSVRSIQSRLKSWIFYNQKAKQLCQKFPTRSTTVYFDDLVTKPKEVIRDLSIRFNWGNLDIETDNLDPTKTHLIGNQSRHSATKVRSKQLAPTEKDLLELGITPKEIKLLLDTTESLGLATHPGETSSRQ